MELSPVALALRTLVSLAAVFALLALAARALQRYGSAGRGAGRTSIELLARQALGRNSSMVIVRTGSKALVVGVTETQVTLLSELDLDDLEPDPAAAPLTPTQTRTGGPAPSFLDALRDRTVRRSKPEALTP